MIQPREGIVIIIAVTLRCPLRGRYLLNDSLPHSLLHGLTNTSERRGHLICPGQSPAPLSGLM